MSYQNLCPVPPVSRQDSHDNYRSPSDMPLANPKEQTLLWQQDSYMEESGIYSMTSTGVTPSLCGKEDHFESNSISSHWHQPEFRQDSHANYSSLHDFPLANPKEQSLLWQQNSYMENSGINSGASTDAAPSLCVKENHSNSVSSNWHQPEFIQGLTEEQMDGSYANYSSPTDMPLADQKEQILQWQQDSYMDDSGIHSESFTCAPPSLCGKEDHLQGNSAGSHWPQSGFKQDFSQGQVDEMNQHLNQIESPRDVIHETLAKRIEIPRIQFDQSNPAAVQCQFEPLQILEHAVGNFINNQNDANLIKLLNCEDQAVVRESVLRVEQLSKTEASQHAIINSPQIVATLVHIIASSNDLNTTESVAGILYNLSLHKQGLLVIFKSNGIPALVKLLNSQKYAILKCTIVILHNLLLEQEGSVKAVCLAEGLQKMISLLKHDNAKFLAVVTDCLRIMAYGNREIKLIILASGCSELVRILRSYTYEILICRTASLLRSLLKSFSHKHEIVEAGGIQALAMHLGHHNENFVLNCLWSLRCLSDVATKQDNVDKLLQDLVHLLKHSKIEIVMYACHILCNMTCNERNKVTVCQVGGIEALVHAITQAGDKEEITEPAVCVLRHVTANHPKENMAQNAVRQYNGLQVLVKLLHPPSRWPLIKAALGLIRNLALCPENRAPLGEHGVIPRIVQLLIEAYWNTEKQSSQASSNSQTACIIDGVRMEEIIERILEILKFLADEAHSREVIRGCNIVPLLDRLSKSDNENIQRAAGKSLHNIAADNRVKMLEAGHVNSHGSYSRPANGLLVSSTDRNLLRQQNSYTGDSGNYSGSSSCVSPNVYGNKDDLNNVPVSLGWEQPRFRQVSSQEQVDATYVAATQFQVSENKSQKCKQRSCIEPSDSLLRCSVGPRREKCTDMDVNMLDPAQACHDKIYQGSQDPPNVHSAAPRHNPYTPNGFDLPFPVDSMLCLGNQVGHVNNYETPNTDMDFDCLPDINFDTLENILPPSSQDSATQKASWCNADYHSSMLPSSPQNGATNVGTCYNTESQDPRLPTPSPQYSVAAQRATWYNTDHSGPFLPPSPQDSDAAQMATWLTNCLN